MLKPPLGTKNLNGSRDHIHAFFGCCVIHLVRLYMAYLYTEIYICYHIALPTKYNYQATSVGQ